VGVVVLAVDAEEVLKMALSEDEDPVETLVSERTSQSSAWAFAFGAWIGARIT
jgi:hypothetical protein